MTIVVNITIFILKDAFHIPNSAVNVIGISELSKNIGDFKSKGTRINSSGQDSILTWNNKQYSRSFVHSDSCLPEMSVNDGYSKFYRFCNLIDRIQPVDRQCYHNEYRRRKDVLKPISPNDILDTVPYEIGEEITFKNKDHVEKGIIEEIGILDYSNTPTFTIKFRDDRKESAHPDQISADGETDAADIPISPDEFLNNAKYLNEDHLQKLQNPLPLTDLEVEWKKIHDRHGHLPFAEIDKLASCGVFPKKFEVLRGTSILCPSCIFG